MPYQHIKYKIPRFLDKRIKLSPSDKKHILFLFHTHHQTIRSISREYAHKCCRKTIQNTIYPERIKPVNNKKYYNKNKHTQYIKTHRQYKQTLFLKNQLI